jgi:hypothetical protein
VPDCLSVLRFAPAIKIISRTIGKIFDRLYAVFTKGDEHLRRYERCEFWKSPVPVASTISQKRGEVFKSMLLPPELQPTDAIEVTLPSGTVAQLPLCRPIFSPWTGAPLDFSFGGKPALNYDQEVCFAELAILRTLVKHGWGGVWVEAFGGTHFLNTMPKSWSIRGGRASIPEEKEAILKRIWQTSGTTACFDVFAWKGSEVLLCEAKRQGKDNLTDAQLRFIEGALACGIPLNSFLVAEWACPRSAT